MENNNLNENTLKILKRDSDAHIPTRATEGSAGMDLYACIKNSIDIKPGDLVKIPCGVSISLPCKEYAAFIFPRSGLATKYGVTLSNNVGVIDSDYRGEICVGLCNISREPYTISPDERVAQMIIIKTEFLPVVQVESLDLTDRGEGGFGSTGR